MICLLLCLAVRVGGWVGGWMGGWVAGWLGGWVAGWLGVSCLLLRSEVFNATHVFKLGYSLQHKPVR